MKALLRDRYGSPDVLRFEEIDKPVPTGDEVLVRVQAASLNAADLDFLHGRPGILRLVSGLRRPRNPRIGVDVAGRVAAIGDGVSRFSIGDEVFSDLFSHGMGSLAEYVCAPERAFIAKPVSMTMEEAATLPHAAILALQAVRAGRPARAGERILLNGASGNVGPFAIQIAKSLGMEVTGVCSPAKMDFVRSIGADDVIDYTTESFTRGRRRWDRIVDVSGSRSMFEVRRALTADGVYTWVGGTTSTMLQALLIGSLMRVGSRRRVGFTFAWKPFHAPDVATLVELFESGAVKPVVDQQFPLEEAIDAIRYMDDGHHRGKVVITA